MNVLTPKLTAYIRQPSDYAPSKAPVFYNPVMELNRDLSVLALQAYQKAVERELYICEPLSSSGIRGIRYAVEVNGIKKVLVNDISKRAVKLARHNVKTNNVEDIVHIENQDANCLLSCHGGPKKRFDVVDLDPFGSPAPYIDSALRAIRNNGLLAVTATDLAPLCGVHPKACMRKYGGKPLRTEYCHELAVRLLVASIASTAAKHDIGIQTVFSHSTDHYVRAYVEIHYGAKKADESLGKLGYILHCFSCFHRETAKSPILQKTEKCPECSSRMDYAGPLWLDKILDKQFCRQISSENVKRALRNSVKITRLVELTSKEVDLSPTYHVVDKLSSKMSLPVPPLGAMIRAMLDLGFATVPTHFNSRGFRTEAPALKVQETLRRLVASPSR